MHGTRTTVKMLVGVAVATLSGCVSVETAPPAAPTYPNEVSRPTQDVAPQIMEGPAREALEAALPDPPPPSPRVTTEQEERDQKQQKQQGAKGKARGKGDARAAEERPSSLPPGHRRGPGTEPPAWAEPPRDRADACDLGERYGGWGRDSDQAKICRGTYKK
ncbi:hypothetical protein ACF06X_11030 [Streptomyces sp. NPDC015346]|uniref:hypothetical protein n=1 Tax=Streptomyces sp. NPDC015346 TaxID=3364954 RepID=UPI003702D876